MGWFTKKTKEEQFWEWFGQNLEALGAIEGSDSPIVTELSREIDKYEENLAFEISPEIDGVREFAVSANGISDYIPSVKELIKAAPKFEGWSIIPFKQRVPDFERMGLRFGEHSFTAGDFWFVYDVEGESFDICILHQDYNEEENELFGQAAFIMLDQALGEYDVMTGIRYIEFAALPEHPDELDVHSFVDLPEIFDDFKSKAGIIDPRVEWVN